MTKQCPECGRDEPEGATGCPRCRTRVELSFCGSCGRPIPPEAESCPICVGVAGGSQPSRLSGADPEALAFLDFVREQDARRRRAVRRGVIAGTGVAAVL